MSEDNKTVKTVELKPKTFVLPQLVVTPRFYAEEEPFMTRKEGMVMRAVSCTELRLGDNPHGYGLRVDYVLVDGQLFGSATVLDVDDETLVKLKLENSELLYSVMFVERERDDATDELKEIKQRLAASGTPTPPAKRALSPVKP